MEQEQCDGCGHQNGCQSIYERLSNAKGPSVLLKTVLALLVPLIIFIAAVATCEKLLTNVIENRLIIVLLSILSGVIVVSAYIVTFKMATKAQRREGNKIKRT